MTDLSANMFYKVQFSISIKEKGVDLLWELICHIMRWQTRKWNKNEKMLTTEYKEWTALKHGNPIFSEDRKSVYIESHLFEPEIEDEGAYWACKICENPQVKTEYAPRTWVTEIGVENIQKGQAIFSCVLTYSDRPGFIGKCEKEPAPNVPNLIRNILGDKRFFCFLGIDQLNLNPIELKSGDWLGFWEKIQDPNRSIPYIYISPSVASSQDYINLTIDPRKLVVASGGNAIVYYSLDKAIVSEMDFYTPNDYKCFDGAIRIYMPDCDIDDPLDPYRHRFIKSSYVNEEGEDSVLQIIRRALAQDVHFYDKFFRITNCREMTAKLERQKKLSEIQEKHSEYLLQMENRTLESLIEEEEKRLLAEEEIAILRKNLNDEKEKNYTLSSKLEQYQPLIERNRALEAISVSRFVIKNYPKTIRDIINYFDAVFPDRIAFSDEAIRSSKDCRIDFAEVWKILYNLSTEMYDLRFISESSDIYTPFKTKTGIDVRRGEGAMTHKDKSLAKQFQIEYFGESIDIEAHITYPRISQSIHFGFSEKHKKIIIGSCGPHMQIYSTQKRK